MGLPGYGLAVAVLAIDLVLLLRSRSRSRFRAAPAGSAQGASAAASTTAILFAGASLTLALAYSSLVLGFVAQLPYLGQHMDVLDVLLDATTYDDVVALPWLALLVLQPAVILISLRRDEAHIRAYVFSTVVCAITSLTLLAGFLWWGTGLIGG